MLGEHHRLLDEFSEYKGKIHALKLSNPHFAKLYEAYTEIDKEVYRIEEQIEPASDAYTEDLKKKRLQMKDELYSMLKAA